jgi:pimeloyl-ACP methyl ester carboxylesterase
MSKLTGEGFLDIESMRLEYRMIGPHPEDAPTFIMLHEGLGSAGQWGAFPDLLAAATGAGVFVYSRAGYGKSSPAALPRLFSYMHDEAKQILPHILDTIGFRRGVLIGQSDGASIAAIHAGSIEDHRVRGLVLIAPHFIVEDCTVAAVNAAHQSYVHGDLRARLARWHSDIDGAFHGWNDTWRDPAFRHKWDIIQELAYIRVPILIVQGENDEYGTVRQIEIAKEECYCPVEVALMPGIGHAPHQEALEVTLKTIVEFASTLLSG